jgi:ABC-type Na+ efflux pump permease subunit
MIPKWLRRALRDPFYRCERRQTRSSIWLRLAAALAGLVLCCVTLIWGIFLGAAMMGAETILGELDAQTMENLLLTPADRRRIILAKFLACLYTALLPIVVLMALCAAGGALLFGYYPSDCAEALAKLTTLPFESRHCAWRLGVLLGLASGALAGVLILAHMATCTALGIRLALSTRSRAKCYLLIGALILGGGLVERIALTFVPFLFFAGFPGVNRPDPVLIWSAILGAAAVRLGLLNVLLPIWLLRSSARRMDELLLRD